MNSLLFRKHMRTWYREHGRHALPWRNTRDRYHILVSEMMLQQTQVSRVLEYYERWLKKFPTVDSLARAELADVLSLWSGLGYNRRAKFLLLASRVVMREHRGVVPQNIVILENLPGVGPYTARAVACLSGGECEPLLETNIRRVILHYFFPRNKKVSDERLLKILSEIEPRVQKRDWYLALMDYGASALKKVPNPNRRSRTYVRQSKFKGSSRQLRGRILKFLLNKKSATIKEIMNELGRNESEERFYETMNILRREAMVLWEGRLTRTSRCGILGTR